MDFVEACAVVLDFKEALPLCLKEPEIYEAQFGLDSPEAVLVRWFLEVICAALGKNEEALEQNELA